ncbi:MAG TPA: hypothetical protein VL361_20810 [Candidatus Limnocylindrales bacterium]|nr:hypothetical protein [Candidatus Limnocylindrales bacterium]
MALERATTAFQQAPDKYRTVVARFQDYVVTRFVHSLSDTSQRGW